MIEPVTIALVAGIACITFAACVLYTLTKRP